MGSKSRLCTAIRNKRVIEFSYDGKERTVEPYCFGLSTAGNKVLRGFQISGRSISGKVPAWKLFKVRKIRNLIVLEKHFDKRSRYRRNDKAMSKIFCQL